MSQKFCPECGGALFYDSPAKRYACKSCGIYVTHDELYKIKEKVVSEQEAVRRKTREQNEYLEWWLSSKTKRR